MRILLTLAALLFLVLEGSAQTPLWVMNLANPPGLGFNGANPTTPGSNQFLNNGPFYQYTLRQGVGPTGGPAAEIAMVGVNCTSEQSCQNYTGFGGNAMWPTIPFGGRISFELPFKVSQWNNPFRSYRPQGWGGKMLMVGDGGSGCPNDTWRGFWNFENSQGRPHFVFDRNIMGFGFEIDVPIGQWHTYTWGIQYSTTLTAADAQMFLWVDGVLTLTSGQFNWPPSCSANNLKLGGYSNWMAVGGVAVYQFGGLTVRNTFPGGPVPPPLLSIPSGLRTGPPTPGLLF